MRIVAFMRYCPKFIVPHRLEKSQGRMMQFFAWRFLLRFLGRKPAPLAGTLRWAQFLSDEKLGKESPKAGPSPALWNPPRGTGCPCVLLVSALGLVGSHGWRGTSTGSTYFSGRQCFYPQGLTLVSRCSQRPEARLPAAGTPLLQDRPGRENFLSIGPAAQGCLVWWQ